MVIALGQVKWFKGRTETGSDLVALNVTADSVSRTEHISRVRNEHNLRSRCHLGAKVLHSLNIHQPMG